MKNSLSILSLFCFVLLSCNNVQQETKQILKKWYNKEIIIPSSLKPQIFNRDTNCTDLLNKEFKILLHVNPGGCSECKLKLFKWFQIIEECKYLENKLSFLIVVNSPNIQQIRVIAIQNKFQYPIFYDINGKMDSLNQFPVNENLRCFLLNRENKVILMGNPVNNPQLLKLYLNKIKENEGL